MYRNYLNNPDYNPSSLIIIIMKIFIQGNLFSTCSAVINEGPVSKTMMYYSKAL